MIERIQAYWWSILGTVAFTHLFIIWPITLWVLPGWDSYIKWVIYGVAVMVGFVLVWRTPVPKYCNCPTCGTRVAESMIDHE